MMANTNSHSCEHQMLKPQDIIVVLSILLKKRDAWRQIDIAHEIGISPSEVNGAIHRLQEAKLLSPALKSEKPKPNLHALQEFLIYGLKYVFPATRGGLTRGIPTSYASPVFKNIIRYKENDIPVWPDEEGTVLGHELKPLYPSVTKQKNENLYHLLAIIDAIREGRVREKKLAIQLLEEKLNDYKTT